MRTLSALLIHFAVILGATAQDNCFLLYDANWIWRASDTADLKRTTLRIQFTADDFTVSLEDREMLIDAQNCPFSDGMGQLLFYSNGCYVANCSNTPIPFSDGLNFGESYELFCTNRGYNGTQSMMALPVVGEDSLYYLIHKRERFEENPSLHLQCDNLFSTLVDPYYANKLGKIEFKNSSIVADTNLMYGHLTATRHANGSDWWILSPDMYTNAFYRIKLDSIGFNVIQSQFIGDSTSSDHSGGQAKFSPDGSKYVMYHGRFGVFMFDFDRANGALSNYNRFGPIDSTSIIGGCEFSRSGRFLYVNTMRDVYQYDLEAEDIPASEIHLGHYDGFISPFATLFFHMERTPHGQIFLNSPNGVNVLHVIEEPDKKGLACNFKQHDIILPANIFWSMPHFPNYRLGALEDPLCDTTVSVIDEPVIQREFLIFPNPAHDQLSITAKEVMNTISVYSLSGSRIQQHFVAGTEKNLYLGLLDKGFYMVEIVFADGARSTRKIVLQK